ncbi:MAG: translation elongation factor Ts [Deltaproteobacteria bacterium]|nr:translation elongation factor Ts [Deltaproteobacteria bacterium]
MAEISASTVKEVRERSGAGMMDCKNALVEANGDVEKALEIIQKKGLAKAVKKAGRVASEGLVHSYIHAGGRIGVLVEINCETDFVSRNEDFKRFCDDVAMQIAGMSAQYVRKEEIPADVTAKQKEIFQAQLKEEGKPEQAWPKILEGKLSKWAQEICLNDQESIVVPGKNIEQVRAELVAKIGENINIRRFVRWELGEGIEKKKEDYAAEVAKMAAGNG